MSKCTGSGPGAPTRSAGAACRPTRESVHAGRSALSPHRACSAAAALERDLDDELAFHLEQHAAMDERGGVPREEALRRARLAFGGVDGAKEQSRDGRGVRLARGRLARSPLRRPHAGAHARLHARRDRLADARHRRQHGDVPAAERAGAAPGCRSPRRTSSSRSTCPSAISSAGAATSRATRRMPYPLWEELRERQEAFSAMFAWADEWFNLAPAGEVRRAPGLWVSGDYFPALGLTPALGRLFTRRRRSPGLRPARRGRQPRLLAARARAAIRRAIGRTLTVRQRVPVDVIGVAPAGFHGLQVGAALRRRAAVLLAAGDPAGHRTQLTSSTQWWITAMGRLKPGWTIERPTRTCARSRRPSSPRRCRRDYPARDAEAYSGLTLTATPAGDRPLDPARGATPRRSGCCSP